MSVFHNKFRFYLLGLAEEWIIDISEENEFRRQKKLILDELKQLSSLIEKLERKMVKIEHELVKENRNKKQ